jgi:hypothetical protein
MELVPVVGVVVVVVIATSVCMGRARLGNRMDRSLEELKSQAGLVARPERVSAAPIAGVLARRPSSFAKALTGGQVVAGRRQRVRPAAVVDPHVGSADVGSAVPKAS